MNKKYSWFVIVIVVLAFGALVWSRRSVSLPVSRVDLDRPLIVAVTSWPGYASGILANRGFRENAESVYTKKYGLPVRFVLMEDIDARGKAFAKGGPEGVDVVWSTVDFWANELPNLKAGGIDGRAFLQLDWSRGGDALIVNEMIHSVEDLKNKKIALTQFTPSHWLFESILRQSKLSPEEQETIRKKLVFTQDSSTARAAFIAGQIDGTVVWEPDVTEALKRTGAHILMSTKDFPNSIADIMVTKKEFIEQHPKTLEAFVRGWLDGVEEAKQSPNLAAKYLMENEPLFQDLGLETTKHSFTWTHWPNLQENAEFFGLTEKPSTFDALFRDASLVWQSLDVIKQPVPAMEAKDDSILRRILSSP